MSNCPKCGGKKSVTTHVVGIVTVRLAKCACKNIETKCVLLVPFAIHEAVSEVERLRKSHSVYAPPHVKAAIVFLQNNIDLHAKDFPKHFAERRQKLLDRFERDFLKKATEEYA